MLLRLLPRSFITIILFHVYTADKQSRAERRKVGYKIVKETGVDDFHLRRDDVVDAYVDEEHIEKICRPTTVLLGI